MKRYLLLSFFVCFLVTTFQKASYSQTEPDGVNGENSLNLAISSYLSGETKADPNDEADKKKFIANLSTAFRANQDIKTRKRIIIVLSSIGKIEKYREFVLNSLVSLSQIKVDLTVDPNKTAWLIIARALAELGGEKGINALTDMALSEENISSNSVSSVILLRRLAMALRANPEFVVTEAMIGRLERAHTENDYISRTNVALEIISWSKRGIIPSQFLAKIEEINSARVTSGSQFNSSTRDGKILEALKLTAKHGYQALIDILNGDKYYFKNITGEDISPEAADEYRATAALLLSEIRTFADPGLVTTELVRVFCDEKTSNKLRVAVGSALTSLFGIEFFDPDYSDFRNFVFAIYGSDVGKKVMERIINERYVRPVLFLMNAARSVNDQVSCRNGDVLRDISDEARDPRSIYYLANISIFDLIEAAKIFESLRGRIPFGEIKGEVYILLSNALDNYANAVAEEIQENSKSSEERLRIRIGIGLQFIAMVKGEMAIPFLIEMYRNGSPQQAALEEAFLIAVNGKLERIMHGDALPISELEMLLSEVGSVIRYSPVASYELSKLHRNATFEREDVAIEAESILRSNFDYILLTFKDSKASLLSRAFAAVALATVDYADRDFIVNLLSLKEDSKSDPRASSIIDEGVEVLLDSLEFRFKNSFWTKNRVDALELISVIKNERALLILLEAKAYNFKRGRSRLGLAIDRMFYKYIENNWNVNELRNLLKEISKKLLLDEDVRSVARQTLDKFDAVEFTTDRTPPTVRQSIAIEERGREGVSGSRIRDFLRSGAKFVRWHR